MNKHSTIVSILLVLLAGSVATIIWLYVSLAQSQTDRDMAIQQLQSQKQTEIVAKQQAQMDEIKAQDNLFKFTWPVRNSQLCYERPYSISWQAPADMDAVTIVLYSPTTSSRIGDFRAVSGTSGNIGYGSFLWDLTNAAGAIVEPSQVYHLTMTGTYHGRQISTSTDGVFSISACNQ